MGKRSSPPVQTVGDEWRTPLVRNWNRRCWFPITNGSLHKPAVMLNHHQRLVLTSPVVFEPAVMRPSITAGWRTVGDSPSHHHRHKSNAPRTVGDAHFEPAMMRGAGVVIPLIQHGSRAHFPCVSSQPAQCYHASGNSAANQAYGMQRKRGVETMAPLTMRKTCHAFCL